MCFQIDLEDNLASATRTGRKTTKYKRGTEAIWPPVLERALLDGLQQYFPPHTSSSSRQPRQLQRFPQRNKFISEHILRMTGVFRTAKQVGSRLQQLRETSTDTYILFLIRNKVFGPNRRCMGPSNAPGATRSLRSSPSTDVSDYDYDYSTSEVTPSDVHTSIEQQQEDAIRLLQAQQQASVNLVWEQTSQALSELPTSEYQYQPEDASISVLGAPFGQQELVNCEPQQLAYEVQSEYGAFFATSECEVSVGAYNTHAFTYENVSPLTDVDSPLYNFSPDSFTIHEAVSDGTYPTLYLP